jgi:hypothetical protein
MGYWKDYIQMDWKKVDVMEKKIDLQKECMTEKSSVYLLLTEMTSEIMTVMLWELMYQLNEPM